MPLDAVGSGVAGLAGLVAGAAAGAIAADELLMTAGVTGGVGSAGDGSESVKRLKGHSEAREGDRPARVEVSASPE